MSPSRIWNTVHLVTVLIVDGQATLCDVGTSCRQMITQGPPSEVFCGKI